MIGPLGVIIAIDRQHLPGEVPLVDFAISVIAHRRSSPGLTAHDTQNLKESYSADRGRRCDRRIPLLECAFGLYLNILANLVNFFLSFTRN